jgi:hypothetical protein
MYQETGVDCVTVELSRTTGKEMGFQSSKAAGPYDETPQDTIPDNST